MSATAIILHHYPQSPVSEKVRIVLGIKGLAWRSVEIPRLPPKPKLTALTGGYRRTPVMQIGSQIYCDSQCIIRELQRRFPEPTIYPHDGAGLVWGVARWTDGPLFKCAIAVVFGSEADRLPEAFARDRGRLYFGPDFDLDTLVRDLPHALTQLRAQLAWVEERLRTGRSFLLGEAPGLPDALVYHVVWFVRGRCAPGPDLLAQFPALCAWEERVGALGHGMPSPMNADEALTIARTSPSPATPMVAPGDPLALTAGTRIRITPQGDGGDAGVEGALVSAGAQRVALSRSDPDAGTVTVHFPRVGYRIEAL